MTATYTVRLELEFPTEDMPTEEAANYAEYLLSPVLATLDTLGLTAKQVEMFDAEHGEYKEICQEDVEMLNDPGDADAENGNDGDDENEVH